MILFIRVWDVQGIHPDFLLKWMAKCPLASGGVRIGLHWGLSLILPSSINPKAHLLNKCQAEPFFTLVHIQEWSEIIILCEFEAKIVWMAS